MQTKMLILAAASLAFVACSKSGPAASQGLDSQPAQAAKIIGGQAVAPNDPIAATIVAVITSYPVPNDPTATHNVLCTGSLITDSIVITAAHCVYGAKPLAVHVVFGTDVRALVLQGIAPQNFRDATQLVVHGWYGRNQDAAKNFDDIAMIGFTGGLPAGYHPANLLQPKDQSAALRDGGSVLLAGYGINVGNPAQNDPAGKGVLRRVVVPIQTANWSNLEILFNQTSAHGACHNDSGGPAYTYFNGQTLLFGITSRGVVDPINGDGANSTNTTPDYCNHYSAYSNILSYQGWVVKKIRQIANHQQAMDDDGGAAQDPTSVFGPHRKIF